MEPSEGPRPPTAQWVTIAKSQKVTEVGSSSSDFLALPWHLQEATRAGKVLLRGKLILGMVTAIIIIATWRVPALRVWAPTILLLLPFCLSAQNVPCQQPLGLGSNVKTDPKRGRGWGCTSSGWCMGLGVGTGAGVGCCWPYLVVLVGGDGDEVGLGEHVGAEGAVGQLEDVVGPHDVEAGLVFVHGVQNGLWWRGERELSLCSAPPPSPPCKTLHFSSENNKMK